MCEIFFFHEGPKALCEGTRTGPDAPAPPFTRARDHRSAALFLAWARHAARPPGPCAHVTPHSHRTRRGDCTGGSGCGPGWGGRSGEPVRPQEGTCITEHRLRGSARLVGGTQLPRRLAVALWWSTAFHVLGGSVSSHTGGGDLGSGLQACYPPSLRGGSGGGLRRGACANLYARSAYIVLYKSSS